VNGLVGGCLLAALFAAQSSVQLTLREGERLRASGNPAAALELYNRALAEAGSGSRDRADALLALTQVETVLGRYPEARTHAREAAGILEALNDARARAMALNDAGLASLYEGNYQYAEEDLRAAVDLSRAQQYQEGLAEQLGNLANVHFFVGRYAIAARLYEEALAVTSAAGTAVWTDRRRRILLANQASLYLRLGRAQQALEVYQQLGAMSGELPPVEQAQLLANLGVLYRRLGDPVKSLETYDQARQLFARDRHVDGEIGVLKNRGIVLALDLGRLDEAERDFSSALDAATAAGNRREMLHAHLYRAETLLRAGNARRAESDYAEALTLARELRTPEEEWKALYGLGRTSSGAERLQHLTQAVATVESIREGIRIPTLRSDFLTDKREVYDALLAARLADGSPPAELFGLLERSHSRVWRERLGLRTDVDLTAVQHALPEGVLLLDYWHSPAGSAVIAVTRNRDGIFKLAINDEQIAKLVDSLEAPPSTEWRTHAAELSSLLPPSHWLDQIGHILIVTDGSLALVPFELLNAGDRLLIERAAVSYTPTAATLLREQPSIDSMRPPWSLQMRAFGAPLFGASSVEDLAVVRDSIRETENEVRDIASELAGRDEVFLGSANLKANLVTPARAPVLHIASHAMADANAIEQSRILFSPPPGTGSDADYLFLKEAYELDLDGVELAVLSACDTARGQLVRGEGVQSFSRAFLASGARSTVTTLWRVADGPTRQFMRLFYHHLQQGLSRDEALRQTKRRFMGSDTALAAPHYWAAFVLTGDGDRPLPTALTWTAVIVPAMAVLAVGIVLVARVRVRSR
jgi:CHAT domain-containing protein/tetratricopeptide (TPR) repeat protein